MAKTRNRAAQDVTLNLRALKQEFKALAARVAILEAWVAGGPLPIFGKGFPEKVPKKSR